MKQIVGTALVLLICISVAVRSHLGNGGSVSVRSQMLRVCPVRQSRSVLTILELREKCQRQFWFCVGR
jgi:hypothetical protein